MTVLEWYRHHTELHNYKMNQLYKMVKITKQGHYKRLALAQRDELQKEAILSKAAAIRKDHKKMGCRKLYNKISPEGIGRDKTENLLLENGFRLPRPKNYTRTTYAGKYRFNNLISDKSFDGINQLWVSDITYITVGYKKYYYLTLVQDVYSRMVVGWSLSDTMLTEHTVAEAYKNAIKTRACDLEGLVFHSDRGSQYGSELMQALHKSHKVNPSMGNKAWENAHAESINGVLKNEYISLPQTGKIIKLKTARKYMENWIRLYNDHRPHGSLKNQEPTKFETFVEGLAPLQRPIVKINY